MEEILHRNKGATLEMTLLCGATGKGVSVMPKLDVTAT